MLTAKEARELVNEREFKEIETKIRWAIQDNDSSVAIEIEIQWSGELTSKEKRQIKKLKELEYIVSEPMMLDYSRFKPHSHVRDKKLWGYVISW